MNPVMIIGAVAATSAIPILAWTFLADGSGGGRRKVGAADLIGSTRSTGPSVDYRSAVLERSTKDRAIKPMFEAVVRRVRRLTPSGWSEQTEQRLAMAGMNTNWSAEKVLAAKTVGLIVGLLLSFWFFSRGISSKLNLGGFLGCAPFGFFLADIIIKNSADKRQQRIMLELPDILDQITVGVEAGLGFDAAMARSAKSKSRGDQTRLNSSSRFRAAKPESSGATIGPRTTTRPCRIATNSNLPPPRDIFPFDS